MGLIPFSSISISFYNNVFSPFISQSRYFYNPLPNIKSNLNVSTNLSQTLYATNVVYDNSKYYYNSKQRESPIVPFCAKDSPGGSNQEDRRALDAVLRLYEAIENRNLNQLSDVIGEECRCVCNFVSSFQSFNGKKQVVDFFSTLMRSLGNNIEFVVKPVLSEGMNVGVSWKLEWKNTHFPLGKGFSFYICHVYQGKLFIRNVEMFIEPLLHVEPLRLKMLGIIMSAVDKVGSKAAFKGGRKRRDAYLLFTFFFVAALLFILRLSLD